MKRPVGSLCIQYDDSSLLKCDTV